MEAAAAFLAAAGLATAVTDEEGTMTDDNKDEEFLPPCISASAAARAAASLSLAASFLAFSLLHFASQSARSSKRESSQVVVAGVRFFKLVFRKDSDEDASLPLPPPPAAPPPPTTGPTGPFIAEIAFAAELRSGLGGGEAHGDEPDEEEDGGELDLFEAARRFVVRRVGRLCRRLRRESQLSRIACEILSRARSVSPFACIAEQDAIICHLEL